MMKKHTKIFKEFLKKIGFKHIRVRNAFTTEADMNNGVIYYSMKENFENTKENLYFDKIVRKIYAEKNYDIKISIGTFAFFHELGHIISRNELKNFDKSFNAYINGQKRLPKNKEQRIRKYRELRLEKLADKYGYVMYKLYEKQALRLDKKIQKLGKQVR